MRRSAFRLGILGAATGVTLLAVNPASAASDQPGQLPNIDVRDGQKVAQVAPKAAARLDRALGPQGFLDPNPQTGAASFVGRTDGFLTARSDAAPKVIVEGYVTENQTALGLDDSDLADLKLTESYTSIDGVTHVTYGQTYAGLQSYDTYVRGNVTDDGRLINISGSPQPDLSVPSTTPRLSADEALLAARENVGGDDTPPPVKTRSTAADRRTTYETYAESARLVIFAQSETDLLAWEVQVLDDDSLLYRVAVDALTGDILARQSLTAFDNNDAEVWPYFPNQNVDPIPVNLGTDPSWLDRSAAFGHQLIGNNTRTYVDSGAPDGFNAGEEVTRNGGLTGNWTYPRTWYSQPGCPAFGCTWNSANLATKLVNRNSGAVGLFYLTNRFHDHLLAAPIGFNEASRNFEQVNSSGQGVGNDAVLAEAQDYSGINNANFSTPADGSPGRMQMYFFNGTPGAAGPQYDIDGSASADIVYHEYAHGLSNRLVGNGTGLAALQSRSMGEGWSDFYAMDLLVHEGSQPDTAGTADVWMGEYATGVPGIFGGISRIRYQPIDCTPGAPAGQCPAPSTGTAGSGGYTFGDLGRIGSSASVHNNGELWSQTLWDLRKTLGRTDALKIITGGMRLSPNSPSMINMRDAILQSARVNGVNANRVWAVFAARGMGYLAATPNAEATVATENFSMPPALLAREMTVNDNAPRGDGDGSFEPGETLAVATTLQNLSGAEISGLQGTLTSNASVQLTRPDSGWPAIPSGQGAANSPFFAATIPDAAQCGVEVPLSVSVTGAPVSAPPRYLILGAPNFTAVTDVPKNIPDNNASGVTSTFTFPGAGTVQNLDVRIGRINHTWPGDVRITLTHGATTVTLVDQMNFGNGGAGRPNIVNLQLRDDADTPVALASYDEAAGGYSGTYRAEQSLAAFRGHSLGGAWTLRVSDLGPGDVGSLQSWALSSQRVCDAPFGQPTSVTGPAASVATTTSVLTGQHGSNGRATDYQFEWGSTADYDQTTALTAGGAGAGAVPVTAEVSGLTPSTTYHYRLIGLRDGVVLSIGDDQVFTTSATPVTAPAGPQEVKDMSAPSVTITKAPKRKVVTRKAKAKVSVLFTSEAGATFTCKVDKSAAKPCTSPFKTSVKAKPGKGKKHVIVVVAKDAAGNSSVPATVAFKAVRKR